MNSLKILLNKVNEEIEKIEKLILQHGKSFDNYTEYLSSIQKLEDYQNFKSMIEHQINTENEGLTFYITFKHHTKFSIYKCFDIKAKTKDELIEKITKIIWKNNFFNLLENQDIEIVLGNNLYKLAVEIHYYNVSNRKSIVDVTIESINSSWNRLIKYID